MFSTYAKPSLQAQHSKAPMNRVSELGEAKIANMEFHLTVTYKLFTDE
jgi:hypothetical protein